MDSDLDRTHTTFDEHSAREFEEWLDEMDRLSDPERIASEDAYWARHERRLIEEAMIQQGDLDDF